jgi:hypothetical protein
MLCFASRSGRFAIGGSGSVSVSRPNVKLNYTFFQVHKTGLDPKPFAYNALLRKMLYRDLKIKDSMCGVAKWLALIIPGYRKEGPGSYLGRASWWDSSLN